MNDQENPEREPGFDDPAYDDLRALLAEARVTEPVPADVAARLDETLAALTADRRTEPVPDEAPASVVPLRRRSRLAPRLLAAAAAVVVVGAGGVGLAQVLSTQSASDDMVTAESADAPDVADEFGPAAPEAEAPRDQALNGFDGLNDLTARLSNSKAVPRFTTAGFAREAAAFSGRDLALTWGYILDSTAERDEGTTASPPRPASPTATAKSEATSGSGTAGGLSAARPATPDPRSGYFAAKAACPGPVGTEATLVPILYDGRPASLAVYPVTDGTQLYEAWSCDGRILLASARVQA